MCVVANQLVFSGLTGISKYRYGPQKDCMGRERGEKKELRLESSARVVECEQQHRYDIWESGRRERRREWETRKDRESERRSPD